MQQSKEENTILNQALAKSKEEEQNLLTAI